MFDLKRWSLPLDRDQVIELVDYLNDIHAEVYYSRLGDEIEFAEKNDFDPSFLTDCIVARLERTGSPLYERGKEYDSCDESLPRDWIRGFIVQLRDFAREKNALPPLSPNQIELWGHESPPLINRQKSMEFLNNLPKNKWKTEIVELTAHQIDLVREYLMCNYGQVYSYIKAFVAFNSGTENINDHIFSEASVKYVQDSIIGALGIQYSAALIFISCLFDEI